MKTKIIILTLLMVSFSAYNQTMHVHKTDGSITSIDLDLIEKITFELNESSFLDPRDGEPYTTVQIGDQIWMSENLAYLPSVSPSSEGANDEVHYYVLDYEGSDVEAARASNNYQLYGTLYSWEAALTACPSGWHLPTQTDWDTLINYLGTNPGEQMKSTTGWKYEGNGTNSSGFNAYPVGLRKSTNQFSENGSMAHFWSSHEISSNLGLRVKLSYNSKVIEHTSGSQKELGYTVRCIKD